MAGALTGLNSSNWLQQPSQSNAHATHFPNAPLRCNHLSVEC